MPLNVAFAGTPEFAATVLGGILDSEHEVRLVISQPDARRGRGRKLHPPPVAELARAQDIRLLQPERASEASGEVSELDVLVVAAYGQILRADMLYAARLDSWNVHASLLPKYRGAAPIERAIMDGETTTGITIMKMDEGLDTGDMALKKSVEIPEDMDAGDLTDALSLAGSKAIVEVLTSLDHARVNLSSQDSLKATYASKVSGEDQVLDLSSGAVSLHNVVRALSPRIGARVYHEDFDGPIKLWKTRVVAREEERGLTPGLIYAENGGITVGCGSGELAVEELQPPGGRKMPAAEFLRGRGFGGTLRLV